jgi:hypothetical protein
MLSSFNKDKLKSSCEKEKTVEIKQTVFNELNVGNVTSLSLLKLMSIISTKSFQFKSLRVNKTFGGDY